MFKELSVHGLTGSLPIRAMRAKLVKFFGKIQLSKLVITILLSLATKANQLHTCGQATPSIASKLFFRGCALVAFVHRFTQIIVWINRMLANGMVVSSL